jgi:hypothetical protein
MFGFPPKLPINDEERQRVDEGFQRLEKMLGRRRMLEAQVILPTAEHFPDPYDNQLLDRVCTYSVWTEVIELEIFPDETEESVRSFHLGTPNQGNKGWYVCMTRTMMGATITTTSRLLEHPAKGSFGACGNCRA